MGLFSSIISAVGNAANDIFGGGNSSDDSDNLKKKQNAPVANNNIAGPKVNLPTILRAPSNAGPSRPITPVFTQPANNNANLTAGPVVQPPAPPSGGGGFFHDLTHNPVTNVVGHDIVSPTINAGKDVGEVAAAAVPEVGLGVGRVATGLVQGVTQIPHIATSLAATGTKALADTGLPGTGVVNDVAQGANTGVKVATNFVNKPLNWVNRGLDTAAQDYSNVGPLSGMGEQDYKDTQIPLNVIAGLATLGGGTAAEAAGEGGEAGTAGQSGGLISKISDFLSKTRGGNPNDIISKTAQPVINATRPVVSVLNAPVKGVTDLIRGGTAGEGAGEVAGDEGAPTDSTPPESGTKAPDEPVNAPAGGEPSGTSTVAPGATEAGVKPGPTPPTPTPGTPVLTSPNAVPTTVAPPEAAVAPAPVQGAESTAQQAVDKASENPPTPAPAPTAAAADLTPEQAAAVKAAEAPNQVTADEAPNLSLKKTGNSLDDLTNAAKAVHDRVETGADFSNNGNAQELLNHVNGRQQGNTEVARIFGNRLDSVLSKEQQANVQDALQNGTVDKLTGDEKAVAQALQQHLNNPADALRSATDKNYVTGQNYSTQIRQGGGIRSAAKTALNTGQTLKGKVSSFNDLLQQSRFSQARTLGKFTSGNTTKFGDPGELGLVAKKDGSFVDKTGKSYQYSPATNKELTENGGVKLQDLSNSSKTYATDTMNLKARTDAANELVKNPEKYGLSETATENGQPSVTIKDANGDSHEFFTDKGTQKALQESGITTGGVGNKTSLPVALFNKASSGVVQSIVANPTVHGLNQLVQGMTASGLRANGLGGLSFLKDAVSHGPDDVVAFHDAGGYVPSYGKDAQGVLSKLTFGGSKLNEKAMSAIDGNFRVSAFKSLTDGGMDSKEAAATVNKFMGDRSVFKDAQPNITMFMHYFKTLNVSAKEALVQTFKGHPGALTNASLALAATYGLQKAFQNFTGNSGASVHAPGVVGLAKDYAESVNDLRHGQVEKAANPIINRINPLVSQTAEQLLNANGYGGNITTNKGLSAAGPRADFAATNISPLTDMAVNNGHSLGEKVLNTFGLYTPHIKGDMATNNPKLAPVLNVKGAQNGSTVAFPKDFTGEQGEKALDNYLDTTGANYSSKTAATIATQSQAQQKAYTQATTTLKKVGITDASDVQNFSKLSSADQGSYVKAATQLNTAGTAISSSSIQDQLVKNGNTTLAASLNKNIPSSLDQNSKTTLETYSTLGSDGQKSVWLQNNDNADNYYKATISQKQAQGALTTADTDTGTAYSGSGGSLYVKALVAQTNKQNNVSQSLVEQYKNTTKTEYENMSGTEKTALTNYADQLNANGVIDKFGIAEGTSGGSSTDSATAANDRDLAAGIPMSGDAVVKPTKTSDLKAGTAKYVAPKLAAFTATTAKNANPFIRSISASKGVKI